MRTDNAVFCRNPPQTMVKLIHLELLIFYKLCCLQMLVESNGNDNNQNGENK